MKKNDKINYVAYKKASFITRRSESIIFFLGTVVLTVLFVSTSTDLSAQSGGWDALVTVGTAGSNDYGNGVIRLLSDVNTGCSGAAVHETTPADQYDPTLGNFSHCYQVFFGCPGNDDIGSDVNGDGMAFSFWKSTSTYNINNGLACGGGLGYMGSASDGKMITIEFDTWSSQCNSNFDCMYGGGTSGDNDEIALQRDGNASDAGRITSVNAGNLEDGLEHTVCIAYNRTTHILSVTIDGAALFTYDLTGSPYELSAYFGVGGLNQTWSSGKAGATNPATVTPNAATSIVANLGGVPLCPAGVEITSPSDGSVFNGCPVGPITINATATPPAGNTTTYVEFFIDGVSIGIDNTANYFIVWPSPSYGNHTITAVAHWSAGSTSTSSATTINVGGVQKTSTPIVIDGSKETQWNNYSVNSLQYLSGTLNGGTADLGATYRMTYDNTSLYILVDVTDDVLNSSNANSYDNDGVEIYIDMGNTKTSTYQSNDYQFAFVHGSTTPIEYKTGNTTGVNFKEGTKAGGYLMEISIAWSRLGGVPANGTKMGFDVGVNDNDDGTRDNQLSWNNGSFQQYTNPSTFGTVEFSSCDPLPVKMLSFTAKMINGTALLNWSTTEEINNEKFIIERSLDASHWEPIGEVAAKGDGHSIINYSYTDLSPLSGASYYRLQQIDVNGDVAYSQIATVEMNTQHHVNFVPNPFDDVLTISSDMSGNVNINIYNVLGGLLYNMNKESSNGVICISPELPAGTYIVSMQTSTFIEQQKVIKK